MHFMPNYNLEIISYKNSVNTYYQITTVIFNYNNQVPKRYIFGGYFIDIHDEKLT